MTTSYLLCCVIIAATMGGENFIEIKRTGSSSAVVEGKVRYFGETTHMASAAASATAVEGIHEISEPLGAGTTLQLHKGCELFSEGNVFTFNGGGGHSVGRWGYSHGVGDRLKKREPEVNALIRTISEHAGYLDWTVRCPEPVPKAAGVLERRAIKKFYSQITKITVSGTKTGTDDRPLEEIPAGSIVPPKTQYVFDELSKPGATDPWLISYWQTLHAYLIRDYSEEITFFLAKMIHLIKDYKIDETDYGNCKEYCQECTSKHTMAEAGCKASMSQIYDTFIKKDSSSKFELNLLNRMRDALGKPRKKDAWVGISPEGTEWEQATAAQINIIESKSGVFIASPEYMAWLKTKDGRTYMNILKGGAPAAGIGDEGPDTGKRARSGTAEAVQLDNNVYRRGVYDRYDVAAAYLRGYKNGLLERLNK